MMYYAHDQYFVHVLLKAFLNISKQRIYFLSAYLWPTSHPYDLYWQTHVGSIMNLGCKMFWFIRYTYMGILPEYMTSPLNMILQIRLLQEAVI